MRIKPLLLLAITAIAACLPMLSLHADEGMWLPLYIAKLNHPRMQALGLELSAEEVFSNRNASLKDAIVWFNGGCTAEVISKQGLLLTNHHCGFTEIAKHSTLQNNYLRDGFWAKSFEEELPNPGLQVSFVRQMYNVTSDILEGLDPYNLDEAAKKEIKARLAKITERFSVKEPGFDVLIRPMYYNTEYYVFVIETFKDVRLVGAPPSGVGKFGGDADNWMWPRHTGDFSMFRIYANDRNQAAEYSKTNVPYQSARFLPISLQGVKPGDFTMVYGFPGRTQQYISSFQTKLITEELNRHKIALRTKRLNIIDKAMASSDALRLMYADQQATIANAWKKWQGETKGVARLHTIKHKSIQEQKFTQWAEQLQKEKTDPNARDYTGVVKELQKWTDSLATVALATEYYREAVLGNGLLAFASTWEDVLKTYRGAKGKPEVIAKRLESLEMQIKEFYGEHDEAVEQQLTAVCLESYRADVSPKWQPAALAQLFEKFKDGSGISAMLFQKSALANKTKALELLQRLKTKNDTAKLVKDPALQLLRSFTDRYVQDLQPRYVAFNQQLERFTGIMLEGNRKREQFRFFYPDANSTLRVAFGNVATYQPADGVTYKHYTTLDGVMAKDNPAVEEFNVPAELKRLWKEKDFGRYEVNGTVPVAFIANNHTTGGNSGSPVIDGKGRLIGTNFDRCWEGTMSDIQYDKDMCRNIALDVRYTLFIIEKLGKCQRLIDEMDIQQ